MEDSYENDYRIELKLLLRRLKVQASKGLSSSEANRRSRENGANVLPKKAGRSWWRIFLNRFRDVLMIILVAAAMISLATKEYYNTIIIALVVVADALLSFTQKYRTERVLERIQNHMQPYANVLRDGVARRVLARDLVVGDIIEVREGESIPADARLIESHLLTVREAVLTGESNDTEKEAVTLRTKTPITDRKNMIFMGTTVVSGSAMAVVVATGARTELGKIAQVIKADNSPPSPLSRQLNVVGLKIGAAIFIFTMLILIIGLLKGESLMDMLTVSMTLLVSAVPEDLTMIMTIALTVGVARILEHKGVVRLLSAAETLGSASVICTDKTGTLTSGEMEVEQISFLEGDGVYRVNGNDRRGNSGLNKYKEMLITGMSLLSDARYVTDEQGKMSYVGTATERSILKYIIENSIDREELKRKWRKIDSIGFDRKWKYKAALYEHEKRDESWLFVSGAPDILLARSVEAVRVDGERVRLHGKIGKMFNEEMEQIAANGKRMVGMAVKMNMSRKSVTREDINDLLFLGLIVISDKIRDDAKKAVSEMVEAGVMVKIITGDHLETARAVAREVGIPAGIDGVMTAENLENMNDGEVAEMVERTQIFSRVSPLDKQRIVRALQSKGHVVAMTGDGVNDAVALKGADIGVAMGSSQDVAREAADLVLLNDSFATMVSAIVEGRVLKDNIKKVIGFLLATNLAEVAVFFVSLLAGAPLPLLPAQILWVNLVTDGTSDIALAFEPRERNVMRRGPEKKGASILDGGMVYHIFFTGLVMTIAIMLLYGYVLSVKGYDLVYARTIVFAFISAVSLLSVWSFRSLTESIGKRGIFGNKWIFVSLLVSAALQLAAIYVPALQKVFSTRPLLAADWGLIILIAMVTVIVIDGRKAAVNLKFKMKNAKQQFKIQNIKNGASGRVR